MSSTNHTHAVNPEHPTIHDKVVDPNTASSHQQHQQHNHHQHHHQHPQHTDPTAPIHPTNAEANTQTFQSADPTTDPHAKTSSKLAGDLKGMVHGVTGSLQAATGTMLRNKNMQDKGFEKMSEEDQRLAAKSGKPPVGTNVVTADSAEAAAHGGSGRVTNDMSHKVNH